jgi:probable F420-dependent oxidoreductase
MRFGVSMFVTDRSMPAVAVARAVEERGLDSLWLPEHTHIPVSRKTPYPLGTELPDEYKRTVDPFVALASAAAVTSRIRLGTGICLVAQRDPIVTAKEVATLDVVSGGRFTFGVGLGWNEDELEDHGVAFKERRAVVRERMLAMQRLWADDVASFEGAHVKLPPSWAWPKPVQRPRPPVFLGGAASPRLFEHVAEYGDGWIPLGGSGLGTHFPELRAAFEKRGRDPGAARVIAYGVTPVPGKLEHLQKLGVEEAVFFVPSGEKDAVMPALDACAEAVRSVQPTVSSGST